MDKSAPTLHKSYHPTISAPGSVAEGLFVNGEMIYEEGNALCISNDSTGAFPNTAIATGDGAKAEAGVNLFDPGNNNTASCP